MASSLPASLFLLPVVFWQFVAAADPVPVKALAGTDVTLPCQTAGDKAVVQAEWSRPDRTLAPVLLYKNGKVDHNQLAAYRGRTSLLNVRTGDLSLVLKKVVSRDAGQYECRAELREGLPEEEEEEEEEVAETGGTPVLIGRASGRVLNTYPISIVILTVEEQIYIKATTGLDVTLPCRVPANNPIQVVEWRRPGLGPKFVLLFTDGMMDVNQQHPSFRDRVELLYSDMKNGDVSMVLKKVQARDTGQFECRVIQMAPARELTRMIYLYIAPLPVPEQTNIKATTGLDVTLPCSDPDYNPIQVVQWSRAGLWPKFVLLFKDGMMDENKQHPSFKDRVKLLDSDMKDGDVSMVLKKVQASDTGLFECRVIQMAHGEELRRRVYLDVVEPFPAWVIVLAVLLSVCLTAASVLVYKNRHHFTPVPVYQDDDEDDEDDEYDDYGEYDEYEDMKMDSED